MKRAPERSRAFLPTLFLPLFALALVPIALGTSAAVAQEGKRQEFRVAVPPWAVAGRTTTVQLFGQDLAPSEIRFEQAGLTGKVVKAEDAAHKNDEEKKRGNRVVTVEITAPAGLKLGYYPFTLVGEGLQPGKGELLIDTPAPEMPEAEPNNELRKPQALPPGSVTVLGKLDNEGVDVFRIEGKAGERWRFEVFARRLGYRQWEPVLRLRDPRLAPLRAAADQGEDCYLEYTLPADGPYVLELFDGDNRAGGEFSYRLAVRKL